MKSLNIEATVFIAFVVFVGYLFTRLAAVVA